MKYTARTCNGCHTKFSPRDTVQSFPRKRRAYHPRCMPGGDTTCKLCRGSGKVRAGGDLWRYGWQVSFTCHECGGMGCLRRAS